MQGRVTVLLYAHVANGLHITVPDDFLCKLGITGMFQICICILISWKLPAVNKGHFEIILLLLFM